MARRPRELLDRGVFHVLCATSRGEPVFDDESALQDWLALLGEITARDRWSVLAWCVLSDRYQLAVRSNGVPLARSMRQLQGTFAQQHNRRRDLRGPLWQGRYQARAVAADQVARLIEWIHTIPVRRGLVNEPAAWARSGHRQLSGQVDGGPLDLDVTLQTYDAEEDKARSRYLLGVLQTAGDATTASHHRDLPWWRRGAPPVSNPARAARRQMDEATLLERACDHLGVELERLAGRRRDRDTARLRELVATVAVERCGARTCELARLLGLHPDWVSHLVSRGVRRRASDLEFGATLEGLQAAVQRAGDHRRETAEEMPARSVGGPEEGAPESDWAPWM